MDRTYHSHISRRSTLAPLHHHFSRTLTYLFSGSLPSPCRSRGMPLFGPHSAADSHISV
jgi:hypothetical protein